MNEAMYGPTVPSGMCVSLVGFEVAVDHPHPHVVKCMHLLRGESKIASVQPAPACLVTTPLV